MIPAATPALESQIRAHLSEVAPDADLGALQPEVPFRDQFDFDSMDVFNFAVALHTHFGLDIPARDYRELSGLDRCAAYLRRRLSITDAG
jgi:acyl carrier protein